MSRLHRPAVTGTRRTVPSPPAGAAEVVRARALLADEAAHAGRVEWPPGGAVGPDHLGGPGGRGRHRGAGAGDIGPVKT